ncbi:MAG: AbrB/MazE/SpoVT family DNA-binding domain-containing protein [archaeon]
MPDQIIKVSKITSNRQVTIPKEIMKRLKLKTGDKIVWIEQNNNITIKKGKIITEN